MEFVCSVPYGYDKIHLPAYITIIHMFNIEICLFSIIKYDRIDYSRSHEHTVGDVKSIACVLSYLGLVTFIQCIHPVYGII